MLVRWHPQAKLACLSCHTDFIVASSDQHVSSLAKQARELFVVHVGRALPDIVKVCETRLMAMADQVGPAREMQERRDAWMAFQKCQTTWLNQSRKAFQRTLLPRFGNSGNSTMSVPGRLELMAEGVIGEEGAEDLRNAFINRLEADFEAGKNYKPNKMNA